MLDCPQSSGIRIEAFPEFADDTDPVRPKKCISQQATHTADDREYCISPYIALFSNVDLAGILRK
jgi:hypothetical protein